MILNCINENPLLASPHELQIFIAYKVLCLGIRVGMDLKAEFFVGLEVDGFDYVAVHLFFSFHGYRLTEPSTMSTE